MNDGLKNQYNSEATKRLRNLLSKQRRPHPLKTEEDWQAAYDALKDGADPNPSSKKMSSYNILHSADRVKDGKDSLPYKTLALALEKGAELRASNGEDQHQTPLHKAVEWAHPDLVALFIEKGAPLDAQDMFQKTPMHISRNASPKGMDWRPDNVLHLVRAGARLDIEDENGCTAPEVWAETLHAKLLFQEYGYASNHAAELEKIYLNPQRPELWLSIAAAEIIREFPFKRPNDCATVQYMRGTTPPLQK